VWGWPCSALRFSVGVILFNHSDADFQVKVGDRVAQLILERIAIAEVEEVEGDLELTSVDSR
jgi:dUTP pyrophosphatase